MRFEAATLLKYKAHPKRAVLTGSGVSVLGARVGLLRFYFVNPRLLVYEVKDVPL